MEQRDGTFRNRRSNRQEGGKDVESQGRRQEGPGRGAWTQLSQSAGSHGDNVCPKWKGAGRVLRALCIAWGELWVSARARCRNPAFLINKRGTMGEL